MTLLTCGQINRNQEISELANRQEIKCASPQPLNDENLGGITMKFFNLTFTESYVLPVGLDVSGFEMFEANSWAF